MNKTIFPKMIINLNQVTENVEAICRTADAEISQLIAIVKDNCYGLGSIPISKHLITVGVNNFAVATIEEAIVLRENGINGNLIVLGPVDKSLLYLAINHNIRVSIVDHRQLDDLLLFDDIAKVKLELLIDTGMHRYGITQEQLNDNNILDKLKRLSNNIDGIFTHFHSADSDDLSVTKQQSNNFNDIVEFLGKNRIINKTTHLNNSAGSLRLGIRDADFIRSGISIYGGRPTPDESFSPEIKSAVTIEAKVKSIRSITSGEGSSYGHIWKTDRDTDIATVAIGYGDGMPRCSNTKTMVIISGNYYPIVGRITMDSLIVDIGKNSNISIDDIVTIVGKNGDNNITIDELAINTNTISYELFCCFGPLLSRDYRLNNKTVSFQPKLIF